MSQRQIIGLGGGGDTQEQSDLLWEYVLEATGKPRPRMLYLPTAIGDDADGHRLVLRALRAAHRGESPASRSRIRRADLRALILDQDAICVSGGNTANMLAIWRVHGIDALLREAWESGDRSSGARARG